MNNSPINLTTDILRLNQKIAYNNEIKAITNQKKIEEGAPESMSPNVPAYANCRYSYKYLGPGGLFCQPVFIGNLGGNLYMPSWAK